MIDNRGHSVVVLDKNDNEIFSLGQAGTYAIADLHTNSVSYAALTRQELREIAEAIVLFTNTIDVWQQ